MQNRLLMALLIYAFLSFAGWLFIYAGIKDVLVWRKRQARECVCCSGVIVDYVRRERRVRVRSGRSPIRRTEVRVRWYPVVEYRVGERVYRRECEFNYRDAIEDRPPVGETLDLRYDADDPIRFHLKEQARCAERFNVQTIVIGTAWVAVSVILTRHCCPLN